MMLHRRSMRGTSMIEVMIAISIGAYFLTSVLSTWYASSKSWFVENQKNAARICVEKGIERIKADARLSTYSNILYYPQFSSLISTYQGISIPMATPDANGLLTRSGGQIVWDKQVLYYVYNNQLQRTVISTYSTNVATRQNYLNTAVTTGTVSVAGATVTTTPLFSADSASLSVVPQTPTFDGYASSEQRSPITSFGSISLAPGAHTIQFEVTGKNASASSWGIGIDSVAVTPSGGHQEAEVLTISAQSGAAASIENMSGYGSGWGGNYQVHFPSTAVGNSVSFSTNYDQWLESNFANMTYSNTKTTGTNPYLTLSTREDASATSNWTASAQAGSGSSASNDSTASGMSVRTVISGAAFSSVGGVTMMRFKFSAASNAALVVGPAYFGVQGSGPNISGSWITQLYFDNSPVNPGGSDGVGAIANPGTATGSLSIPAGGHVWTNWFAYTPSAAANYLVSAYVSSGSATVWSPSPLASIYNYRVSGNQASSAADWTTLPGYDGTSPVAQTIFGVTDVATWSNTGTATSQIYDTRMTSPGFNQIAWTPVLQPAGSTITFQARSSPNADMSGATAWTAAASASPASLGSLSSQRYIQWRTTITAASPYDSYPTLENVKVDWPGQSSLVEISGYYTKRPSYGIFKVLVDGVQPTQGLNITLSATKDYRGESHSYSLTEEQKPLNTGK